jgi:hypothetical protein
MPFTTPVKLLSDKSWQDTEPVFIQSSPQRMGQGPARRVLRRRNNHVLVSLRTPESPTVVYLADKRRRTLGQAVTKTGNRRTNDFVEVPGRFPNNKSNHDWLDITIVPVIDPLDLTVLSGYRSPAPGQTVTKGIKGLLNILFWLLTYYWVLVDLLDCDRNVGTFNPAKQGMSEAARLFSVDSVITGGLVKKEFWKLFLKCQVCHNFMTARSVDSHVCPGAGQWWFVFVWPPAIYSDHSW